MHQIARQHHISQNDQQNRLTVRKIFHLLWKYLQNRLQPLVPFCFGRVFHLVTDTANTEIV